MKPSLDYDSQKLIQTLIGQSSRVILGKEAELKLALCCLIAGGHLLIEDVPGVGKTTMVKTLAKLLGLGFSRIQFTSDLLPSDIIGINIFDPAKSEWRFQAGPLFASLVLGDELNRASPRTQSACLQAMEEGEVSLDGHTYPLPKPFYLIATQNSQLSAGTYQLPESQLDRFLMRISLGYPERDIERKILLGESLSGTEEKLNALGSAQILLRLNMQSEAIHCSEAIMEYVLDLVQMSRSEDNLVGLSPRAAKGLLRASKAWAYMRGSTFLIPEDIQAVAPAVLNHRLWGRTDLSAEVALKKATQLIQKVPIP